MTLYMPSNDGLNSLDPKIARSHFSLHSEQRVLEIEVKTLSQILELHRSTGDIHFLKIDVEGFEGKVLKGNSWDRFRPWIVLLEATVPMSQVENYGDWEPYLLQRDYTFAYADGLNRFYLANEHLELMTAFKFPPNVFDNFIRANEYVLLMRNDYLVRENDVLSVRLRETDARALDAEIKLSKLEENLQKTEMALRDATTRAEVAVQRAMMTNQELLQLRNSRSWRITSILRWITRQIRLLRALGVRTRIYAGLLKMKRLYHHGYLRNTFFELTTYLKRQLKHSLKVIASHAFKYRYIRSFALAILPQRTAQRVRLLILKVDFVDSFTLHELSDYALEIAEELKNVRNK